MHKNLRIVIYGNAVIAFIAVANFFLIPFGILVSYLAAALVCCCLQPPA